MELPQFIKEKRKQVKHSLSFHLKLIQAIRNFEPLPDLSLLSFCYRKKNPFQLF